ncbi:MAG: hypothetical protein P9M14_09750 [Candidatus Alcyoniella australis]|nr:hypothetical protein [Candidatus Alcyoniella australis]
MAVVLLSVACDGDDDDDDASDDDSTDDDDEQPVDPYQGMAPSGPPLDDILGISSHLSRGTGYSWTREFELERLKRAGVDIVRTDFHWRTIEAQDDVWYFDGYDTMVDLVNDSSMRVNAILDFGVDWAMPGGSHNEIDPAKWADYTGTLAAHYADRIDLYEVWNEQNTGRFWKPEPNPQHYGLLLEAAYDAVHEADDSATVIFGGIAAWIDGTLSPDGMWEFLLQVWQEHPDVCEHFDALAIHPYAFFQQSRPEHEVPLLGISYPSLHRLLDQAYWTLDRVGCPDKPIYLTEMGWPDYFLTKECQAAYLARSVMISASRGVVGYYWYTFWDGSGNSELITEDFFGLYTWPGDDPQPKPSYSALMGLHQALGDQSYAGDLAAALDWPENLYAHAFANENGQWAVGLWRSDFDLFKSEIVSVPLHPDASGTWWLYDQMGNLIGSGDASAGAVEVLISGEVSYLKFTVE